MAERKTLGETVGLEEKGELPKATIKSPEGFPRLNPEYLAIAAGRLLDRSSNLIAELQTLTSVDDMPKEEVMKATRVACALLAVRFNLKELVIYGPTLEKTDAITDATIDACRREFQRIDDFLGFEPEDVPKDADEDADESQ